MMENINTQKGKITLGASVALAEFAKAARCGSVVLLAESCKKPMAESLDFLKHEVERGAQIYGVTTGLGALHECRISAEEAEEMQARILRSHAVSVGEPLKEEQVRGIMMMVVQNLSRGYSGVRVELIQKYIELLNKSVIPWVPGSGSVGYLCPEAHIGLTVIGEGRAYFKGRLMDSRRAMGEAGTEPLVMKPREALAVISGTTSATALGALALNDMLNAAKAADIIAAMNVEVSGGQMEAFDERVMLVRPHERQAKTAANIRNLLKGSEYLRHSSGENLQDPLSVRCIPQLHGAASTLLENAQCILETEINSCCDNPVIYAKGNEGILSACNADSSFVGMAMDSACIAAANLAKISERRTYRLLDGSVAGLPEFLIKTPGINSGLMIVQYAQAGLLNEMRLLSMPASVDSVPTSAGQEDYVAMGYNAARKALSSAEKLEYILAIELLTVYQAGMLREEKNEFCTFTRKIFNEIGKEVPEIEVDVYLHDYIELLRKMIHTGRLVEMAEAETGPLY